MRRISFHSAVAFVSMVATHCAFSQVVGPSTPVADVSQAEWSTRYLQWGLSLPADMNPNTSEFSHLGDQGPVFFLGVSGGEPITFDVTIDSEDLIFLPLLFAWCPQVDPSETEEAIRADCVDLADISLFLRIDNEDAPVDLFSLRQQSPPGLFEVAYADKGIFGDLDPEVDGSLIFPSVSDGFYAMLEPLSLGKHTIEFGASLPFDGEVFSPSTTANVTVVPEPSTALLSGFGLMSLIVWQRKQRCKHFRI